MEKRIDLQQVEPLAFKAMYSLEAYLKNTQLSATHKELIKIRASQINGCAFCLDMHTRDALSLGVTPQWIILLDAWKETDLYSAEEKVILALTEHITLISNGGLPDDVYNRAVDLFGDNYVGQLIMAIVTINSWNRIAISTRKQPGE
ncbi:MAG: carboxymuconolactone decarboxylase family protein [Chitinophagaceae bacterium]